MQEKTKGKVLVVDDDPILVMSLKLRLTRAGFEIEDASDGREALEKIKQYDPDIILADIIMPRMDGYELHRELRKNPDTASIPFVFLTAKTETSEQLEGLRMGADDYVCKPFQITDLIERMQRVMEKAERVKGYRMQADFTGNLSQMEWTDILQIAELNHKSGELVFRSQDGEQIGSAFFNDGRLINARMAHFEAEEAFFSLMAEIEGYFEFFGRSITVPKKIDASNTSILLRGSRMVDEYKNLTRIFPNFDVRLKLNTHQISTEFEEKVGSDYLLKVLSLIDKGQTVRDILNSGEMSIIRAAAIISDMLREKIVVEKQERQTAIATISTSSNYLIEEGLIKVLIIIKRRGLTGQLEFGNREQRQAIFFQNGKIVHAFHGKVVGKKALFRIFRQRSGTIKFHRQPVTVLPTISGSVTKLLDEGSRELRKLKEVEKAFFNQRLVVKTEAVQELFRNKNLPGLRKFLSLVQQYGKVSAIVDASELTDSKTYEQISYLFKINVLATEGKRAVPIRLITDSTSDLTPELADPKNIKMIPLNVHFGQTVYKDGVTIAPSEFYDLLESSDSFPYTNPPSVVDFHQLFKPIVEDEDILGIFISRKMSKTFEHAMAVREENFKEYLQLRREKHGQQEQLSIELIDSELVSLGLGLLVLEAAEMIEKGLAIDEIAEYIKQVRSEIRTYFVVDTLEYLKRGGRIGKASALLGTLLRFKPILGISDGEVAPKARVRGGKNAQQRVIEIIREDLQNPMVPIKVGLFHAKAQKWAERMRDLLDMNFNCQSITVSMIGPTVGTHCGPGTVAVSYLPVRENPPASKQPPPDETSSQDR